MRTFAETLSLPVVIGGHEAAQTLGIQGIPSAALLEDTLPVWTGHPLLFESEAEGRG